MATKAAYELNQPHKVWPTYTDLEGWLGDQLSTDDMSAYEWAINAAVAAIARRCELDVYERSTTPSYNSAGEVYYETLTPAVKAKVPQDVWLATVMQAARWAERKDTPNGLAGGEIGETIRTSSLDPDVMELLGDYIVYGLA